MMASVMTVAMIGVGTASAQTVPTGYPRWFIGTPETIRSAGSDTTFFMMQRISDLFMQAGLYGCTLSLTGGSSDYSTCNTSGDISTTDLTDNYDRVEVMTGIDQIGSGEGQKQLCGADTSPFPVDFARSSKPPSSSNGCSDMVGLGFAKDAVPSVDFPGAEGPGTTTGSAFGNQVVGPVAAGWLPGDPVNCDQGSGGANGVNGCSGTPFNNLSNADNGGGIDSTAWRLWCSTDTTPGAADERITDWGQLTNLAGGKAVGDGTPIGIPANVVGVNPPSGTEATFAHYADSGQTTSGSDSCGSTNTNASTLQGNQHIALENNAAQIGDFAAADFPASDPTRAADEAAEVATSLYFMSNGVYQSNSHVRTITLSNGTQYGAIKMEQNGLYPSLSPTGNVMENTYPTARSLYNVYRTSTVRASTADFLNWICDSNNVFQKGEDLTTGKNYDQEITTLINTTFGFIRLTDTTASPNNSCQLITSVAVPNS
jgi:hypothetical protein